MEILRLSIEALGGWAGLGLGLLATWAVYSFNRDQLRDRRHLALCYVLIREGVKTRKGELSLDDLLDGEAIDDPRKPLASLGGIKLG